MLPPNISDSCFIASLTSEFVHSSSKHLKPVFVFQIMQNTLSPYWAKFMPAGGIFVQFYWTFRGAFPLRWATASLVPDSSAELCQRIRQRGSPSAFSLSSQQIWFLRFQLSVYGRQCYNQPLDPSGIMGGPCSDLLCAWPTRVLPSFNLVHILLEHNR